MANARLRWNTYKPSKFDQAGALIALKKDPSDSNIAAFAKEAKISIDEVNKLLK